MSDDFDLDRFVRAQEPVYAQVVSELRRGRKTSHWMWFVFPQLRGLGMSAMAQEFGIASLAEAEAYLDHPVLGPRLVECSGLVLSVEESSVAEIFGPVDAMKFRSSMTLFREAAREPGLFAAALGKYFAGQPDPLTLGRLR